MSANNLNQLIIYTVHHIAQKFIMDNVMNVKVTIT